MAHKSIVIQRRFNDSGNSKKVAGLIQNRWPLSSGISGRFEPESMATLDRNMHGICTKAGTLLRGSNQGAKSGF